MTAAAASSALPWQSCPTDRRRKKYRHCSAAVNDRSAGHAHYGSSHVTSDWRCMQIMRLDSDFCRSPLIHGDMSSVDQGRRIRLSHQTRRQTRNV